MMSTEMNNEQLTHDKIQAEISNLIANSAKLQAETMKLQKETSLYPLVVGASLIVAGGSAALGAVAVAKLFL